MDLRRSWVRLHTSMNHIGVALSMNPAGPTSLRMKAYSARQRRHVNVKTRRKTRAGLPRNAA